MTGTHDDVALYDRLAEHWWDERHPAFASLHRVNRWRLAVLHEWLPCAALPRDVVDLGCGGGLMAVPIARAGASVVGVDRSARSLACAHAQAAPQCSFVCGDVGEAPLRDGCADLVLLADVIEHVERPGRALGEAARLLRAGGHLFVTTINRTLRARWLVGFVAERLGLIPRGTHDPRRFVAPAELDRAARRVGLERVAIAGQGVALVATLRERAIMPRRSRSIALAYAALYRRAEAA